MTHPTASPTNSAPAPYATERVLDGIGRLVMPLALPVALLLFLQWPLRDLVGAGATAANDLAQWIFALYVAVAIRHADRRHAHLTARPDLTHAGSPALRRWRAAGAALCVLPWALYVVAMAWPHVWQSVTGLERFPETRHPGFFMIRVAMLLLALMLALQSACDLWRALRRPQG